MAGGKSQKFAFLAQTEFGEILGSIAHGLAELDSYLTFEPWCTPVDNNTWEGFRVLRDKAWVCAIYYYRGNIVAHCGYAAFTIAGEVAEKVLKADINNQSEFELLWSGLLVEVKSRLANLAVQREKKLVQLWDEQKFAFLAQTQFNGFRQVLGSIANAILEFDANLKFEANTTVNYRPNWAAFSKGFMEGFIVKHGRAVICSVYYDQGNIRAECCTHAFAADIHNQSEFELLWSRLTVEIKSRLAALEKSRQKRVAKSRQLPEYYYFIDD